MHDDSVHYAGEGLFYQGAFLSKQERHQGFNEG